MQALIVLQYEEKAKSPHSNTREAEPLSTIPPGRPSKRHGPGDTHPVLKLKLKPKTRT